MLLGSHDAQKIVDTRLNDRKVKRKDHDQYERENAAENSTDRSKGVAEYRANNVLRTEVTSRDVAELAAEMCGPLFAKTTGAQLPVDGGNERVI